MKNVILSIIKAIIGLLGSFIVFVLQIILSLSNSILKYVVGFLLIISLVALAEKNTKDALLAFFVAFVLSPFGLPTIAQVIINSIQAFINKFCFDNQSNNTEQSDQIDDNWWFATQSVSSFTLTFSKYIIE